MDEKKRAPSTIHETLNHSLLFFLVNVPNMSDSASSIQVLSPGVGYGIVVGIGAFFAVLMIGLTYLQNRYTTYSTKQAEEFSTASRSVKPGLIAAGIVR